MCSYSAYYVCLLYGVELDHRQQIQVLFTMYVYCT